MKKLSFLFITLFLSLGCLQAQDLLKSGDKKFTEYDYDGAIEDYTEVITNNSKNAKALLKRGMSYYFITSYNKAIVDLTKVTFLKAEKTDKEQAYYYRGLARMTTKQYQSALADFNEAISLNPQFYEVYRYRGIVKLQLSKSGALEDFETNLAHTPVSGQYYLDLVQDVQKTKTKNMAISLKVDEWKAMVVKEFKFDVFASNKTNLNSDTKKSQKEKDELAKKEKAGQEKQAEIARKEKAEKERIEREKAALAKKEKAEKEKIERENLNKLKTDKEKAEFAKAEKEGKEKAERERIEKERTEKERTEKERTEIAKKEKADKEKTELAKREKAEKEKIELAKREKENADKENITDNIDLSEVAVRPKIWAVVVGVSEYKDKKLNLKYASKDAEDFYKFLKSDVGGNVPDEQITLLTNEQATRRNILKELNAKFNRAYIDDVVIFYIASHGQPDPVGGQVYFMNHDAEIKELSGTAIAHAEIERIFRQTKAQKKLWITDACHSGMIGMGTRGAESEITNRLLDEMSSANPSMAMLTASSAQELSFEDAQWGNGHGVFTYYLLKGLAGEADLNKNKIVTIRELSEYIYRQVADATDGKQHPELKGYFDNKLPMSVVKK